MLGGNEPQWTKPPKPVRRRGAQPAPELDARAAEMRLRQSSTKEETERIEEHLRLLRSVELSGPATPTWIAVTAYLILIVACATSRIASAAGLDAIVSTALAKDAVAIVLLYHVVCAGYALQLAAEVGHKKLTVPWFCQTLYLGWPSLSYLLERKRRLKESYRA